MTGKFIVFEGIDNSGKTTCLKTVSEYLTSKNMPHVTTQEPNLEYGIRNLIKGEILQKRTIDDSAVDLFLFSLDRRLHILGEIEPALVTGKTVLCDRYYHSTIAYQGHLQGLPVNYVESVQGIFPRPDLTLVFDLPAEMAMKRKDDGKVNEKFDKLDIQEKLRQAYLGIAKTMRENIKVIDATQSKEELSQQAIKAIEEVLKQ